MMALQVNELKNCEVRERGHIDTQVEVLTGRIQELEAAVAGLISRCEVFAIPEPQNPAAMLPPPQPMQNMSEHAHTIAELADQVSSMRCRVSDFTDRMDN